MLFGYGQTPSLSVSSAWGDIFYLGHSCYLVTLLLPGSSSERLNGGGRKALEKSRPGDSPLLLAQ
jgi:hypothetical protein